jgi:PTH1 family peptidyl-tRNA hydrolase
LHDELDLAPGKVRVKTGGGVAGHNGLKSLSAHIGNDYVRVRIGIGHPGQSDRVKRHVLHDFAKSDRTWLEPLLGAIAEEAPYLAAGAFDKFQSRVAHAMQTVAGIPQEPSPQSKSAPRPRKQDAAARSVEPAAAETLGARLRRWFGS